MCLFKAPSVPAPRMSRGAPVRRTGGPVARLYSKRRLAATGVLGNIFTTPLGVSDFGATARATTLGGTTQPPGVMSGGR